MITVYMIVLPWLLLSMMYKYCFFRLLSVIKMLISSWSDIKCRISLMINSETSWRLTASHWFALTAVMTAVNQSVKHSFIQWLITSHFIHKSAVLCVSISFFKMKSLFQCASDDSENIYIIVIVTFSETDR